VTGRDRTGQEERGGRKEGTSSNECGYFSKKSNSGFVRKFSKETTQGPGRTEGRKEGRTRGRKEEREDWKKRNGTAKWRNGTERWVEMIFEGTERKEGRNGTEGTERGK
jgi:hypothetical protein